MSTVDKAKRTAIESAVATITKQYGASAIMPLGQEPHAKDGEPVVRVIGTGSRDLDSALGVGGYARGRVIELYGPEMSGKTTLALHAIAEAQKDGGVCAFIDMEHKFDLVYARSRGVKTETLLVSQPDTGEQALDIIEVLARSGAVDLVVVDSVGAMVPKSVIEGENDFERGNQARFMSQALRKLTAIADRTGTAILFINHLVKVQTSAGSAFDMMTGSNALKFYASMRLDVRKRGEVKIGDELLGVRVQIKVAKNKLAPPFKEANIEIRANGEILDTLLRGSP